MAKQLKCGDLMPGCNFVARGASEQEVMKAAAEHAKKAHGIEQITPELAAKVKGAIKDA
jgi:predicted small metal-binding protein